MPIWNIFDDPEGPPSDPHEAFSIVAMPPHHHHPPAPIRATPGPSAAILDAIRSLGGTTVENPAWLIGPCIRPGDCAYIVGEGGAGKSTLAADIITATLDPTRTYCLSGAWNINRELLPPDPRALIINAETSLENDWRTHLMRANSAQGYTPNGKQDNDIRSRCDFLDKDDIGANPTNLSTRMAELAATIIQQQYDLVVIDPVYALFAPDDPSNDAWVTVGMKTLMTTLKAANVTTLALAHPPEGGSTVKARHKPYGSSQQKGQMDAHFGLRRKGASAVELIKLKCRRAGWIPPLRARIHLAFQPLGGGYSSFTYSGSEWQTENPNEFILSDSAREYLLRLPTTPFRTSDVEGAALRRATFLAHVESYYAPQGLLTIEDLPERGSPKLYTWTERGVRARAQAAATK